MAFPFLRRIAAALFIAVTGVAHAQPPTPVTIGWGAYPDVPQIAIAADQDLWQQHGIDTRIIPFASGRQGFEALIGGQLDYVVMAEFPAVSGVLRKLPFSIVASLSQYQSFRVIARSETAITSLAELAGRKIAIPLGTNVHFIVADALAQQGVQAELVNVPATELIPAVARGDVDAIMAFPNAYPNARRVLGDQYQEIPLPGYVSNFVLVASEAAGQKPEQTQRVLAALLQGEAQLAESTEQAQQATSRFVGGALPLDAIRAAWPNYVYRIHLDEAIVEQMARQGQWLVAAGYANGPAADAGRYRQWFAPGPLRALAADRVTLAAPE